MKLLHKFLSVMSVFFAKIDRIRLLIKADAKNRQLFLPGHFYSPIPEISEVKENESKIYSENDELFGIDLRERCQYDLLTIFSNDYYPRFPYTNEHQNAYRFYPSNNAFENSDAITLFCMLMHFKPVNVIEVGSGFSSALMLDTNDHFLKNSICFTFIEPYPETLLNLYKPNDRTMHHLIKNKVQDCETVVFEKLTKNDILFIDSTHVSKIGSDVNHLIFNILPILKPGVIIHFHDILFPFEYPIEWIYKGIFWNEVYVVRAFLQCNPNFEILFFTSYMQKKYGKSLMRSMPLFVKGSGGSLWIRKKGPS